MHAAIGCIAWGNGDGINTGRILSLSLKVRRGELAGIGPTCPVFVLILLRVIKRQHPVVKYLILLSGQTARVELAF